MLLLVAALAWVVMLAGSLYGHGSVLDHHALFERAGDVHAHHHHHLQHGGGHAAPQVGALVVFGVAWLVMIAAMMLPSTVTTVRAFGRIAGGQARPLAVVAAFVLMYFAVWGVFGALVVAADAVVHHVVDETAWLRSRTQLIGATSLAVAGVYQFTRAKSACLERCRHPLAWLTRYYRRGIGAAFGLGTRHAAFCLGCCWALMLLMFSLGVAGIWWMLTLTAVMTYEKVGRYGAPARRAAGGALLLAAVVTAFA